MPARIGRQPGWFLKLVSQSELGSTVTLAGSVASWDVGGAAEEITKRQSGAVQVINDLAVRDVRGGPDSAPPVPPTRPQ